MGDGSPHLEMTPDTISFSDLQRLYENASIRATDKVRALALGVVAFSWVLLSADKPPVNVVNQCHHVWILATAMLAVLSLFVDLLHSLANIVEFDRLRETMQKKGKLTGEFNKKGFLHRSQAVAMWLKIGLCAASCVSLLILVPLSL